MFKLVKEFVMRATTLVVGLFKTEEAKEAKEVPVVETAPLLREPTTEELLQAKVERLEKELRDQESSHQIDLDAQDAIESAQSDLIQKLQGNLAELRSKAAMSRAVIRQYHDLSTSLPVDVRRKFAPVIQSVMAPDAYELYGLNTKFIMCPVDGELMQLRESLTNGTVNPWFLN